MLLIITRKRYTQPRNVHFWQH